MRFWELKLLRLSCCSNLSPEKAHHGEWDDLSIWHWLGAFLESEIDDKRHESPLDGECGDVDGLSDERFGGWGEQVY